MSDKVIHIDDFRLSKAAERGHELFKNRLKFDLTSKSTLGDLPDNNLAFLIEATENATRFLQNAVIRILNLGRGVGIAYIADMKKETALDSYVFFLDQLRFEAMFRLGWLASYPGIGFSIVQIILEPKKVKMEGEPLELSRTHHDYNEFSLRRHFDGEVIIRRLIPAAINAFRERLKPEY